MDVKSREEIIKFAQKLNSTNLSPLRSGNISLKAQNNILFWALSEIFPDLNGDKFVLFNFWANFIISSLLLTSIIF